MPATSIHSHARVLVVDDDEALTTVLGKAFSAEGLQVTVAHNGEDGLLHSDPPPDVVLLDVNMPVLDGFQFLEAFRSRSGCAETPVILTTGAARVKEVRSRLGGKGIVLVLPKPYDLDVLLETVKRLAPSDST
jgi:CheY-like chemotaxis protein